MSPARQAASGRSSSHSVSARSSVPPGVSSVASSSGTRGGTRSFNRQRDMLRFLQHQLQAAPAEHIAEFMRVADDRGDAARHHGARELRQRYRRALGVEMRVDETRQRVAAAGIDLLRRLGHRHVGRQHTAAIRSPWTRIVAGWISRLSVLTIRALRMTSVGGFRPDATSTSSARDVAITQSPPLPRKREREQDGTLSRDGGGRQGGGVRAAYPSPNSASRQDYGPMRRWEKHIFLVS